MIARAVSVSARWPLTERAPRIVTATSDPIADNEIATTESATSTSIRVKPSLPFWRLQRADRNNFDSSREPIDAHLIADAQPRQRDGAAARHAGREEADGRPCRALVAALGEQRVEAHILRQAHR